MITSPDAFFIFSKFWFLRVLGVKRAKLFPKITKKCVSHSVSQEPQFWWLWFAVQLCKIMITPAGFFFMFSKAWFFCFFMGGRRAKNDTLLPISVCHTLYIKNCRSYWDFWYTSVKWWHLQMFFLFFFLNFDFQCC